jgi:alpha,alpha-trehalose phosphorylase
VKRPIHRTYPPDPWVIREVGFDPFAKRRGETIFSLANGHLGLRGNVNDASGTLDVGTYINGFYESAPISYGEAAYGLATHHQILLNVVDGKRIELDVGDERLDLDTGTIESYERTLDLRTGIVRREVRWRSPSGVLVEKISRRLVSLRRPEVAAIEYAVRILEGSAPIRITSTLDPTVRNHAASSDPRVGAHLPADALTVWGKEADGPRLCVRQRTRWSRLRLTAEAEHVVSVDASEVDDELTTLTLGSSADEAVLSYTVDATPLAGARIVLTKYLAYATSGDVGDGEASDEEIDERARSAVVGAREIGFEGLAGEQKEELDRFWAASDVEIDGDDLLQQGLRFNVFSIFQSAGRDGRSSLSAKGLTGEGYDGHYFWDTEIFALPFFTYTQPVIARALLSFRHRTLDQARARAAAMSERGALYPWRTINGEEASAYFPAGTAQYHIDADIAYAIRQYVEATGDRSFLLEGGAEVVFETARMWLSLGAYIPSRDGSFSINEVTGPDEYRAIVDDNAYTNLMARSHLRFAADLADDLATNDTSQFARLAGSLRLTPEETAEWRRAADAMRIPRDPTLGIHAQDDTFLQLERWDFENTPPDRYPLLLNYHPLVLYRHQVLKQPDVVLAQTLLPDDFSLAEKKRNFDYYDPLTTGDSSLAPSIQSVAAAELGYADLAYDYFMKTARMDLDDVQGNVDHGVHIAAMAGSWFALVHGFAGLRLRAGRLTFAPRLPARWPGMRFRLHYRGTLLAVSLTAREARYELLEGEAFELEHFSRTYTVAPGRPVVVGLDRSIEAVIFDLDGVLTDTAELHYRGWKRLADELGIPFDRTVNERLKGVGRLDSLDIILTNAGRTVEPEERVALAARKNGYYRQLIADITPDDLLPGVVDLLRDLRASAIATAVASASANAKDVIDRLGIRELIDVLVDPTTVGMGKPDPEIFLRAAEDLRVRPECSVGVEDAQAGVRAIKAAGMFAIGVGRSLEGADWRVDATDEITLEAIRAHFDAARQEVGKPG